MPKKEIQGWQREAARNFLLRNPDASIKEVAKATNMGVRTVARARKQLADENIVAPGRRGRPAKSADTYSYVPEEVVPEVPSSPSDEPAPTEVKVAAPVAIKSSSLLDARALTDLSNMLDRIEDNEDDAESQKLMLRQVKRMAFDLKLHPDTRMSAMQLWTKLRDMVKSKELGPGKPLTREDALDRLVLLIQAVGPALVLEAMDKILGTEVTHEGEVPTDTS